MTDFRPLTELPRDALGRTPLHRWAAAARAGGDEWEASRETEKLLAVFGPGCLSLLDRDGCTPLDRLSDPSLPRSPIQHGPLAEVLRAAAAPTAAQVSPTALALQDLQTTPNDLIDVWRHERAEQTRFGTEAIAWAQRGQREALLPLLRQESTLKQSDLDRWLREACTSGRGAAVKALLDLGANPRPGGQLEPSSLLHLAIDGKSTAAVEALLKAGLDPNERNAEGLTALHRAVAVGHSALAFRMLQYGADPMATTPQGRSAFVEAQRARLVPPLESLVHRVQADPQRAAARPPAARTVAVDDVSIH